MPGWAWLVIGVAITLLVVLAAPRMMERQKAGFFRPTPNPDAQPEPVSEEAVVDEDVEAPAAAPKKSAAEGSNGDFDFYTLLPGKEVPMTDAELAASEQAEKARQEAAAPPAAADAATATAAAAGEAKPLPAPVDEAGLPKPTAGTATTVAAAAAADPRPATPPATTAPASAAPEDTRYILQAGAFQASGQAEELKARIALLGLGARVESAQIGSRTVYRVRMGPYGTASELAEAKRKLASGGLSAMAVRTR